MKTIKIIAAAMMLMSTTVVNANEVMNSSNAEAPMTTSTNGINIKASSSYKTSYVKDDQGRIINKVIYKAVDGKWCPMGAYSVAYGENENILTYAEWSNQSLAFNRNAVQQHFDSKKYSVLLTEPTK